MLDVAIRGPSGSNLQPWAWVVVTDGTKRSTIAKALQDRLADGPARMRERAEEERDSA